MHIIELLKTKLSRIKLVLKVLTSNDLSNLDLSHIDLSKFSSRYWSNKTFKNTNLKDTNIRFNPRHLKVNKLENINLENVDLRNLTSSDFDGISIEGCNLYNTGLNIDFNKMSFPSKTLYNVKLDENIILEKYTLVDINTLDLNPDYPFTDQQVLQAVREHLNPKIYPIVKESRNSELYLKMFNMNIYQYHNEAKNYINNIIVYLKKYKRYSLSALVEKMNKNMEVGDVLAFLNSDEQEIDLFFENIDFTKEEVNIINNWFICGKKSNRHINFSKCTFGIDYETAKSFKKTPFNKKFSILNTANYKYCSLTSDSYENNRLKKIEGTTFSCNTSVYIKLGNACNGSCAFCKNKSEVITETNLDNIINSLFDKNIVMHLNQIYFGGGEPSLYIKEIKKILGEFDKRGLDLPDWYMFTNGSGDWARINNMVGRNGHIILSRQEIDDKKNEEIMGVNYSLDDKNLKKLINDRKVLLALTYNEMNMRERFLPYYIQFGHSIGIRNFIVQNLESKSRT